MAQEASTRRIFGIAVPLILQQISMQMQVWADRAMLGHVDSIYFSAIGNVLVPYNAITAIIFAICGGTTIVIAQSIGAQKKAACQSYAECSFIGNSLFPLIAFVFFFFGSGFVFKVMGVQSPVLEHSTAYMRIISITLLIMGPVTTSASILQGVGVTKIIMLSGIVSNILNIFLDWVLIYGKFGFPPMNIEGAAYASIISNAVAAPITIVYVFTSKRIPFAIDVKKVFTLRLDLYKNIFKVGLPSGIEFLFWNAANIIVVIFLNRLDIFATGIYTLLLSIKSLAICLYLGFAKAALTLVGHKTGENNHQQAIRIGFKCLGISLIVCSGVAAMFIIFPRGLLSIFTNDMSLIDYTVPIFILVSCTMFPQAVNIVIGHGIRGMGDTKWMVYSQCLGTVLVVICAYILIFPLGLGLWGIFITMLVDETIRGIINMLRFWKGREFFFMKPFGRG